MGRLSLRARILGAFLLSFLSFCGALLFGLSQLESIGGGLEVLDEGYLPLSKEVGQIEAYQGRLNWISRDSKTPDLGLSRGLLR